MKALFKFSKENDVAEGNIFPKTQTKQSAPVHVYSSGVRLFIVIIAQEKNYAFHDEFEFVFLLFRSYLCVVISAEVTI